MPECLRNVLDVIFTNIQKKKGHYSHLISSLDFCLLLQYLTPFVKYFVSVSSTSSTTFSTSIIVVNNLRCTGLLLQSWPLIPGCLPVLLPLPFETMNHYACTEHTDAIHRDEWPETPPLLYIWEFVPLVVFPILSFSLHPSSPAQLVRCAPPSPCCILHCYKL